MYDSVSSLLLPLTPNACSVLSYLFVSPLPSIFTHSSAASTALGAPSVQGAVLLRNPYLLGPVRHMLHC